MRRLWIVAALPAVLISVCLAQETAKTPEPRDLLASRNLADWDFFLDDPGLKKEDVWSFNREGNLVCKGEPIGYLCTKDEFQNFKLTVQWRWPQGVEPTNSGVLMRITGTPRALPSCIEAQLHHGDAGDIWAFHGTKVEGFDKTRLKNNPNHPLGGKMAGIRKLLDAENPPGEWNTYEILFQGGTLVISLNGKIVNWTKDAADRPGRIGLQSEGGLVEFRNVIVTPLPR
jgi:hypothetical protein